MTGPDRRDLGQVFNEVPELCDRVRPACPDELFADLVAITGMDQLRASGAVLTHDPDTRIIRADGSNPRCRRHRLEPLRPMTTAPERRQNSY